MPAGVGLGRGVHTARGLLWAWAGVWHTTLGPVRDQTGGSAKGPPVCFPPALRDRGAGSTGTGQGEGRGRALWPSCHQGHQAASGVTWSPWGFASCGRETVQKQAIGHQLLPLFAMDVSTGPRSPGHPGLPRCEATVATVATTNTTSQPASVGTVPGVLSSACTASQQAHRPGTGTQPLACDT